MNTDMNTAAATPVPAAEIPAALAAVETNSQTATAETPIAAAPEVDEKAAKAARLAEVVAQLSRLREEKPDGWAKAVKALTSERNSLIAEGVVATPVATMTQETPAPPPPVVEQKSPGQTAVERLRGITAAIGNASLSIADKAKLGREAEELLPIAAKDRDIAEKRTWLIAYEKWQGHNKPPAVPRSWENFQKAGRIRADLKKVHASLAEVSVEEAYALMATLPDKELEAIAAETRGTKTPKRLLAEQRAAQLFRASRSAAKKPEETKAVTMGLAFQLKAAEDEILAALAGGDSNNAAAMLEQLGRSPVPEDVEARAIHNTRMATSYRVYVLKVDEEAAAARNNSVEGIDDGE